MTPDEQYQANLTLLAQRPGMEQMPAQIQSYPLTNMQLVPGAQGYLYGQVWDVPTQSWLALCSPHNPVEEAEKDCDNLYTRDAKIFTLLGMGLGYFATAFAKRLEPWQRLVVWDLDANMFKAMMYACDIAPLFSAKRTDVYIGNEVLNQIEPWWLRLDATDKLYIRDPFRASYTSVYLKEQYDALMGKTVDMMRFHAVGLSTWRMFGGCIGDNDLRNMPEYFLSPGYEHLEDLWKDRPAVCVAAGPSLQKNLALLLDPAVRDKVALICAGTVYGLVHGLGLAPDVVTTIDFQRLNWTDQFQHVPLDPECPLVYLHSTYPQTVRRWPGPKFVAENASDTVAWIRKYGEGKQSAAEVQTVAHLNVKVALALGANPIILLGQDLSMPLETHHAAGARAIDAAPSEAPEGSFVQLPDYQGRTVHTRHSFLSMQTVFHRLIAEHPARSFFNCSEGGLALAGATHLPLRQVLTLLKDAPLMPGTLRRQLKSVWRDYKPQIKETFRDDFQQLCQWVEELGAFAHTLFRLEAEATQAHDRYTPEIRAAMEQATLASDCLSLQETLDECAAHAWEGLLDHERIIQERQAALALFAIRRFDFLELMSKMPPKEDEVPTRLAKAQFNSARLLAVAHMIDDELAHVRALLSEVRHRLDTEHGPYRSLSHVRQQYMRQNYHVGLRYLQERMTDDGRETDIPTSQRYYAQYLYHTQQYEAASAVLQCWGLAPDKVARMQRYLAQWKNDVRQALPAYFLPTETQSQPVTAADAWIWE